MEKNIPKWPSLFRLPDERDRVDAIGSLAGTPIKVKKAMTALKPLFQPIDPPNESDWLWDHEENGQTFESYKTSREFRWYNKDTINTIYIQPLDNNIPILPRLKQFCKAFFKGCKVKMRPAIQIQQNDSVQRRVNDYTQQLQLNARDILIALRAMLPKDGVCIIGVTLVDLYPQDEWNFVFGIGSLMYGTGVFSFARYLQAEDNVLSNNLVDESTLLYRACKIMAHEISHMFGIRHCIFFKCLMNGQNHQEESYRTPLELCVVCVRKLQHNIGFQFLERYESLIEFAAQNDGFRESDLPKYQVLKDSILAAYGPHYR